MHIGRHRGLDEVALGVLVLLLCLAVGLFLRRLDLGKLLLGGHGARRARLLVARLVLGRQVLVLFLALLVERLPLLSQPAHVLHLLGLRVGGLLGRQRLLDACAVLLVEMHIGRHRGLDEVARCVLVLLLLGLGLRAVVSRALLARLLLLLLLLLRRLRCLLGFLGGLGDVVLCGLGFLLGAPRCHLGVHDVVVGRGLLGLRRGLGLRLGSSLLDLAGRLALAAGGLLGFLGALGLLGCPRLLLLDRGLAVLFLV